MQTCVPRGEHTRARGWRLWGEMEDGGGGEGRALREVLGVGVMDRWTCPAPAGWGRGRKWRRHRAHRRNEHRGQSQGPGRSPWTPSRRWVFGSLGTTHPARVEQVAKGETSISLSGMVWLGLDVCPRRKRGEGTSPPPQLEGGEGLGDPAAGEMGTDSEGTAGLTFFLRALRSFGLPQHDYK